MKAKRFAMVATVFVMVMGSVVPAYAKKKSEWFQDNKAVIYYDIEGSATKSWKTHTMNAKGSINGHTSYSQRLYLQNILVKVRFDEYGLWRDDVVRLRDYIDYSFEDKGLQFSTDIFYTGAYVDIDIRKADGGHHTLFASE